MLVAALAPPAGRRLLVAKLDDVATVDGAAYALSTDRWLHDAQPAAGAPHLERFRVEGSIPTWTFALADARLERSVAMARGRDRTVVRYTVRAASGPVALAIKVLAGDRDFHATERASDGYALDTPHPRTVRMRPAWDRTRATLIRATAGDLVAEGTWYRDYLLSWEAARGLDAVEDHLHAATVRAVLPPGGSLDVELSSEAAETSPPVVPVPDVFAARIDRDEMLLTAARAVQPRGVHFPAAALRLVLAADAFVVARPLPDFAAGTTILAGYHWFGDWGRDAAIALPGLLLVTGRRDEARDVLLTFGRHLNNGLLPNDFPNTGEPGYNSADAPLWFIEAVRAYEAVAPAGDAALAELATTCVAIVAAYRTGTRYGIGVDSADGLVRAGEPGVQVTWMDAKAGDWVVTPRIGKPVEINALWYNALRALGASLAARANHDPGPYRLEADRVRSAFARFAGGHGGGLHDVLDGPNGNDAALRPNQIFAVSLPHSPLDVERAAAVVAACARELVTSHGLRSLAPSEPGYRGRYGGDPRERDGAYHQGTVWPWLLGPFALAHARVHGDPGVARAFVEPLLAELDASPAGTLPEIAGGDAPFRFDGAIAQAWSVAETLRAWQSLTAQMRSAARGNGPTVAGS